MPDRPLVVVLGGGPAGSSAAKLLADWGHLVRLITRRPGEARLAVSVPPSTQKLFDAIGIDRAIDNAGFIRSMGNTVWWGSDRPRVEPFAGGAGGWQVPTHQLEELLLAEAGAAGVQIERRVVTDADLATDAWPVLIDATGRSGVLARAKNVREYDDGPRTVALVAEWQCDREWNIPDQSHTLVESYESGWAWSVPCASRLVPGAQVPSAEPSGLKPQAPRLEPHASCRHVAVMVDPQRSGLARKESAREIYQAEIAKTRALRSLVAGASLTGGPWGWDASTYRARRYAGEGWLLAGDAGWFVDPLSSAGVKKALASGWLAAIVAHTCLTQPAMRSHALSFFNDRESALERHHSTTSRRFLADAAPNHPHAFWNDRAGEGEHDDLTAGDAAKTQAAFDALRQAPALSVRRSPEVKLEPRPAVRGREIVLEPHVVAPPPAAAVRYIDDVNIVALMELAPSCTQVPDLVEAYQQKEGPVAFPKVLTALATLVARGWLVAE